MSRGQENAEYWVPTGTKANMTPKAKNIKKKLEGIGHTSVFVWWENIGAALEMSGPPGGYMACSDQTSIEPLGLSFADAMEYIESACWLRVDRLEAKL